MVKGLGQLDYGLGRCVGHSGARVDWQEYHWIDLYKGYPLEPGGSEEDQMVIRYHEGVKN